MTDTARNDRITVFFASDENYIPFLSVALRSMIDNCSNDRDYDVYILETGLSDESKKTIIDMAKDNVRISFINMAGKLKRLGGAMRLRDYYTASIYCRIFIASMFDKLDKAIYMDCDLVVLDDVGNLYDITLGDNILGVISDKVVQGYRKLHKYPGEVLGINYREYFNSGMMVMNLSKMREENIEQKFIEMFNKYHFETIAPDQDYLNFLCSGKVLYLDQSWNVMWSKRKYRGEPKIIHYNMFKKPWVYKRVRYADYFWEYAEKTVYYEKMLKMRKKIAIRQRMRDKAALRKMIKKSQKIAKSDETFSKVMSEAD